MKTDASLQKDRVGGSRKMWQKVKLTGNRFRLRCFPHVVCS